MSLQVQSFLTKESLLFVSPQITSIVPFPFKKNSINDVIRSSLLKKVKVSNQTPKMRSFDVQIFQILQIKKTWNSATLSFIAGLIPGNFVLFASPWMPAVRPGCGVVLQVQICRR